jgi:hypothetical protein
VICPKCGVVNASNFLFCGMCGTILEPARKATAPTPAVAPRALEIQKPAAVSAPAAAPPTSPATPARVAATALSPSISGPSVLGLDQPHLDVLRERAFSGLDSYAETEETKSKGKRVILMILLLAALGGGYWWTYKNYLSIADGRKPPVSQPVAAAPETAKAPPENPGPQQSDKSVPPSEPAAAASQAEKANAPAEDTAAVAKPAPTEARDTNQTEAKEPPKAVTPAATPTRHEVSAKRLPAPKAVPAPDDGEALFRKGQSYLYGRGGTEDCGNALRYLKMASDKQHAKARSMMGTMYATGHCVPRDLPSSYHWFALALRVDPNNGVLEKDLSAVWNQMTPPERQLATKSQ